MQCKEKGRTPLKMAAGSATTNHLFAYFTTFGLNNIYSYHLREDDWEKLPPCPFYDSALIIINGELTAVGGENGSYSCTNKLVTLRQRHWVEEYPPMNTARSHAAVVSSSDGDYIIVIGGDVGGDRWTTKVELFQVSSRRWHQLTDLPQPLPDPSATISGNQLHVIGRDANGYSCSLQALLSSDRPITSQSIVPHLISWTSLPHLPMKYSTAATLYGQLIIIGGSSMKSIYQLIKLEELQWVKIGSMSHGRSRCLVVSPSPDKMMIVGGRGAENLVEDCVTE